MNECGRGDICFVSQLELSFSVIIFDNSTSNKKKKKIWHNIHVTEIVQIRKKKIFQRDFSLIYILLSPKKYKIFFFIKARHQSLC